MNNSIKNIKITTDGDTGMMDIKNTLGRMSCILAVSMLYAPNLSAAEIELESGLGTDSNPFRLSDSLVPQSESYWRNELKLSLGEVAPWFMKVKFEDQQYSGDDRADNTKVSGEVGVTTQFGQAKHELELSLNAGSQDRTYVSRVTGQEFSFGGTPFGDRYDQTYQGAEAGFEFNLGKRQKILAEIEYQKRDYEDPTIDGLSNLDYDSTKLELSWQNYIGNEFRYRISAHTGERNYDERLARDIDGNEIPGVIESYKLTGVDLQTRYRMGKKTYAYITIGLDQRTDNGGGYYDTDTKSLGFRLSHKTQSDSQLRLSLKYRDLSYDRGDIATDIETDAETPSSSGWTAIASYEKPLVRFNQSEDSDEASELSWYIQAKIYDFDADRDIYRFNREILETGLKVEF
jgi:hypothetical protein